jgi:hypothetical protein
MKVAFGDQHGGVSIVRRKEIGTNEYQRLTETKSTARKGAHVGVWTRLNLHLTPDKEGDGRAPASPNSSPSLSQGCTGTR